MTEGRGVIGRIEDSGGEVIHIEAGWHGPDRTPGPNHRTRSASSRGPISLIAKFKQNNVIPDVLT